MASKRLEIDFSSKMFARRFRKIERKIESMQKMQTLVDRKLKHALFTFEDNFRKEMKNSLISYVVEAQTTVIVNQDCSSLDKDITEMQRERGKILDHQQGFEREATGVERGKFIKISQ